jgi:voltage-gated potassium channel
MDKYKHQLLKERLALLKEINDATDRPLFYLSFVWLALIIFELTTGINQQLEYLGFVVWIIFIADYLLEMLIAPDTKKYLRQNWLAGLSLLLPALRIFRIFQSLRLLRATRSLRSLNLLKVISSLNRGVANLRRIARSYGINYIFPLTAIIFLAGAGGIGFFENTTALHQAGHPGSGIDNYADAMWWTAMLMTTFGSGYWPQTLEGRLLTIVLAFYAIAIFGYITATLASLLVERGKRSN